MPVISLADKIPSHTKMGLYEPRQFALLYQRALAEGLTTT